MAITSAQQGPVSESTPTFQSQLSMSDHSLSVANSTKSSRDVDIDNNNNNNNASASSNTNYSSFRSEIEPLNDLVLPSVLHSILSTSEHSRNSNCYSNSLQSSCTSFGESSLSSFLSILLEDEERMTFEIVPDNPKPCSDQRSVRDLRQSFTASALENDRPKCRWDDLTRNTSDRDLRRNKLGLRSSSFAGFSSTKQRVPRSKSNDLSPTTTASGNTTSMFLRMPQRQRSPTDNEKKEKKKSLVDRFIMSETDLMRLPTMPSRRRSKGNTTTNTNRNNINYNPASSGRKQSRLSRSGVHETSSQNASWSNSDVMNRRRSSNQFLDTMMEPDAAAAAAAASPLTQYLSSLQLSSSSSSFQVSQQDCEEQKEEQQQQQHQPQQLGLLLSSASSSSFSASSKDNKYNSSSSRPSRKPSRPKSPSRKLKSPPPDHRE